MKNIREINITEIEGYSIGNAEYPEGATGCTVILADGGAVCGCDVRGGGPASRENALLNPLAANDSVNAVLLTGGSAFGLSAADGIMKYLEERNIGFPTGYGVVPIVCASSIFDLGVGRADIRPDSQLGYQACLNAEKGLFREGCYGAGTGASVGKAAGAALCMKSGLGIYAVQAGELKVGAIVALNAAGDVYEYETGKKIAGINDPDLSSEDVIASAQAGLNLFKQNTTIACIITNADLNKTALCKAAGMAHDGMARSIRPVHTMFDGDTVYVMGNGKCKADLNAVGMIAAHALSKAIERAARPEGETYGLACASLKKEQ